MKSMRRFILTAIALFSLIVSSCISDKISTSSSDILSFSREKVDFDTVFTDLGTPTARLIVSNRAKNAIVISSIRLRKQESAFSINVDGVSGKTFSDVEIRGRDSIYVFIECYIPADQSNKPFLIEDELEFVTNGVTQTVKLEAYGRNVTRLKATTLKNDTRLTSERPYIIFDSLVVAPGVTLSVEPGTQLLFHDGAELIVHGTFEAVGQPGKMIDMRGDRLDNVLPDVGYDILAGQWKGVRFTPTSFGNRMEYVNMRSTAKGLTVDGTESENVPADLTQSRLLLRNSWLHNSQSSVLTSRYAKVDAYGVCFSESADAVVSLTGGEHSFVQCTIANNYLFAAISQPLLSLYYCLPGEQLDRPDDPNPLMKASFENSIIYGLAADLNVGDFTGSDVYLRNVSLKSGGTNDDHFIDCLWECDPLFLTIRPDYIFDYRVATDSPVIGKGNPALVTELSLYDMLGDNRLSDGNPTLGAFARPANPEDAGKLFENPDQDN